MEPEKLLEALHTAEKLKDTTRHCYTSKGRHESVAEHSWRIALMAFWLRDEFPQADMDKVILLASKSSHGRGGMTSKVKTAHDVANAGIKVIIANGNTPNILINLKEHPMETLHTEFVARPLNK